MKLNLGAGSKIVPGYVNVDRARCPGIDVVMDLDKFHDEHGAWRWPWDDDSVERIEADNVFEHVHQPVHFMCEAHRVLQPEGVLHVRTPHFQHRDSWTDPTHVRHCTEDSFAFWVPGTEHYEKNNAAYGGVAFSVAWLTVGGDGQIDIGLRKLSLDSGHPAFE